MNQPTLPADDDTLERTALDVLFWYRAMGIEDAIGEASVDWLARGDAAPGSTFAIESGSGSASANPAPARKTAVTAAPREPVLAKPSPAKPSPAPAAIQTDPSAVPAGSRQFPTASPDAAAAAARTAAREAQSLDALRAQLEGFNGCALKATAKSLSFYRGAARARLMVIGEAPGREEDVSGVPFMGPAGQLLDKMLAAIGLDPADVHITNAVYWRPPGNRTPSTLEIQSCRPFLDRQIELVEPEVVVLMGGLAANMMLGMPGGIMKLRGPWREIEAGGKQFKAIATLHPSFLLRTPLHKKHAWRDMLAVATALDDAGPAGRKA